MPTLTFEIELDLDGELTPYRAATYWQPAEGGEVEDLAIRDAGVVTVKPHAERRSPDDRWLTTSFLKGVDTKNPEVRKLLDNLLNLVWDDAERAVADDAQERAA